MSAKKKIEKEIREAYVFLREKNMSVPSETLQFMLDASLEKLQGQSLPIDSVNHSDKHKMELWDLMQYYMEYCGLKGYVTPREWIENHKPF